MRAILSDRLVHYRKLREWTQYDLAAAAKMKVARLRGYEQQTRWPDPEPLEALARALGTQPADLLGMAPTPSPEEALEVLRLALERPKPESGTIGQIVIALRELEENQLPAVLRIVQGLLDQKRQGKDVHSDDSESVHLDTKKP